MLRYY